MLGTILRNGIQIIKIFVCLILISLAILVVIDGIQAIITGFPEHMEKCIKDIDSVIRVLKKS